MAVRQTQNRHAVAKKIPSKSTRLQTLRYKFRKYFSLQTLRRIVFDSSMLWLISLLLIILEVVLCVLVIQKIKYTEIDWFSYMQEVEGVINGTFDYTKLSGDTGPLVYPAGFVYVYTALYYATDHGHNIRLAQYIFAAIYIFTLVLVFRIYHRSKQVPPYALVFMCCTSYRIHSIFILRMFNDPVAMLLLYLSVNCFLSYRWTLGCVLYSFAVSIKMNILLFLPGLLVVILAAQTFSRVLFDLTVAVLVQVILALPFLIANPLGYITQAFDFGRVFLYEWTVNWRFLPEEIFIDRNFHVLLLFGHFFALLLFLILHWQSYVELFWRRVRRVLLAPNTILMPLFVANFVGVAFSRSLHYQFYVWYFHSLPFLLWSTRLPVSVKILILGVIELSWNIFPSTVWSSGALHICHIVLLGALLFTESQPQLLKKKDIKSSQ